MLVTTCGQRVNKFKQYAVEYKLPNADKVVTNDPMEATYVGINMWKQAVEKAGTTDVDKVRDAMAGQTFAAPSGYTLKKIGRASCRERVSSPV